LKCKQDTNAIGHQDAHFAERSERNETATFDKLPIVGVSGLTAEASTNSCEPSEDAYDTSVYQLSHWFYLLLPMVCKKRSGEESRLTTGYAILLSLELKILSSRKTS
jgi:hypothetical protein